MAAIVAALVIFVIAFMLGSIPWGLVFSKLMFNEDVRKHGSGNIGTTNMIRTYGKKVGYITFVLDFAKGLLAGFVATWVVAYCSGAGMLEGVDLQQYQGICLGASFLGCVWGHIFCPWLGFKGGKGVAVAIGCLYVVFGPIVATLQLMVFIVLVPTTKYVSVGSIASALTCPFFAAWVFAGNIPAIALCTLGGLTVFWAHRGNLKRLLEGTERRVGDKQKKES